MPKRKVRTPVNRTAQFLTILTNLSILHSPCVSEKCTVEYQHCSGCNESYPCKSRQVLDGRSVAQINAKIDELTKGETITVLGDQAFISADDVEISESESDSE
jgi:hypothetical protein